MLQTNQDKQLEYAHCRIIQAKKSINKQIKKEILWDKFTKKIIRKINKHFKIKIMKKLLLLINETESEKTHLTMWTISKK